MDESRRLAELSKFLRVHRAALSPVTAGSRSGPRRRTPGLRREEVASLADVGVTWYTWLEQGRNIRMSRRALERIARALCLNASDTEYFFALAGDDHARPPDRGADAEPQIQMVLDGIDGYPAFVVNPRFDVLAFNRLANIIYEFDVCEGRLERNHIWRAFLDPRRRRLYADWPRHVLLAVGMLRVNYASRIGEPDFEELLDALRGASPEFARIWDEQSTAPLGRVLVSLASPILGPLNVHSMRLLLPDRPGDILFVLLPADDATAAAFLACSAKAPAHAVSA